MPTSEASLHASAVLVGARAALIRGPAGAGKSRLALALIRAAETGLLPFSRLVGDDRILATAVHGNLLVRPAPTLAGLIEVRGLGIRRLPHEPVAVTGMVIDLVTTADRLPDRAEREAIILGIRLPRLAITAEADAVGMLVALARTAEQEE